MFKLCICDDKTEDIMELRRLAQMFCDEHPEVPIQIEVFQSAYDLLDYISDSGGFDLYLLDVIMPEMNGVDLAKRIRERGEIAEIVFLTISREYAVEAFGVKARNYLIKPIQKLAFDREVMSCIHKLSPKENPALMLKTKNGFRKIYIQELVMIESFNHIRVCTLADGTTVVTNATLVSLFEQLGAYHCFFMPHRAYIIHLNYVNGLTTSELLLRSGKKIPVSRKVYANLKSTLLDYVVQKV